MIRTRAAALLAASFLTVAPLATELLRAIPAAHAQVAGDDASGADGGDVSGGNGAPGGSGVLPTGDQNNDGTDAATTADNSSPTDDTWTSPDYGADGWDN